MKCAEHTDVAGEEVAGDSNENVFLFNNRLCKFYHNGEVTIMPKCDGTGPKSNGSITGRGQGTSNPAGKTFGPQDQGKQKAGRGEGKGRGAKQGRGRRQ